MAAHGRRARAVKTLLDGGAQVNGRTDTGQTPLHFAAHATQNTAVIKMLLAAGADLGAVDASGKPPLSFSADRDTLDFLKAETTSTTRSNADL